MIFTTGYVPESPDATMTGYINPPVSSNEEDPYILAYVNVWGDEFTGRAYANDRRYSDLEAGQWTPIFSEPNHKINLEWKGYGDYGGIQFTFAWARLSRYKKIYDKKAFPRMIRCDWTNPNSEGPYTYTFFKNTERITKTVIGMTFPYSDMTEYAKLTHNNKLIADWKTEQYEPLSFPKNMPFLLYVKQNDKLTIEYKSAVY